MKISSIELNTKLILLLLIVSISTILASTNVSHNLKGNGSGKNIFQMKVLALNKALKNNPMSNFDYKFLTLTKLEAVFYETKISKLPTEEDETCTKNYLFTQLYYQIQLPCQDKSLVCTYGDLLKEYKAEYPEINWDLPKKILDVLGDEKAKKNCLVITYDSFKRVKDNIFICHLDLSILNEIQTKLSNQVREVYQKNTELFMEYIPNLDVRGIMSGLLRLDQESLKFINLENKKIVVELPYVKIEPFPYNYYKKEQSPINPNDKAYDQRCIKISTLNNISDFKVFCVFYSPGDFTKKDELAAVQARWLAEFYTSKINSKIIPIIQQNSLQKLAELKDSLEVDSKLLTPVVQNFREKFLAKTNEIKNKEYNTNTKVDAIKLASSLAKAKIDLIKEVCNEIPLCMRALNYKIVKGLLPLGSKGTKFSMSTNNPFNSIFPSQSIKVDELNDGLGKSLVQEVSRLKGTENFFAEEIKLPSGGVPDYKDIIGALATFKNLRKIGIKATSLKDFKNCNINNGIGYQINRKLALLPLMMQQDFIFNFVGSVGTSLSADG